MVSIDSDSVCIHGKGWLCYWDSITMHTRNIGLYSNIKAEHFISGEQF